jgi:hypothetical protein
MDEIKFQKQSDQISLALVITTKDILKQQLLQTLYNEAMASGKEIILEGIQSKVDQGPISAMIFGIGADSKISAIRSDSIFPTFFVPGRLYEYLIVRNNSDASIELNGGCTPNGTDLFSGESIEPNGLKPLLITKTPTCITPFFLWSTNWNGCIIDIMTISKGI